MWCRHQNRNRIVRFCGWALTLQFVVALCLPGYLAAAAEENAEEAAPAPLSPAWTPTIGASIGEEDAQGVGDAIVPIWQSPGNAVFFANPRVSAADNDEQEINLGVGLRGLVSPKGPVLGLNTYYDSRWTEHDNHFNQFGLGLEVLSYWVDARFNAYMADEDKELVDSRTETTVETSSSWGEMGASGNTIWQKKHTTTTTTEKYFERFEASMSGFDGEVGVRVPYVDQLAETRLFVGYQSFDNPWGSDLEGVTARLEVQPFPGLYLDAQYFDEDDLDETAFAVGARLVLPVHSKKDRPSTATRMATEMVMRDTRIQTALSLFVENEARRVATAEKSTSKKTLTDSANFVDGDNNTGVENGTAESPWDTIGEGVAAAFGDKIVKVDNAAAPYEENVVITEGTKVYGVYPGNSGETLGTTRPTVDGMSLGPAFTMQNNTVLAGMHITNTDDPAQPSITVNIGGDSFDIERAGVFANGASVLELDDLLVEGCYAGGILAAEGLDVFAPVVTDSLFLDNEEYGLVIYGEGASGNFTPYVANSEFSRNGFIGLGVIGYEYEKASVVLENIVANNNIGYGVAAVVGDIDLDSSVSINGLQANSNFVAGLVVAANSTGAYGNATVVLNDITTDFNIAFGIEVAAAEAYGIGGNATVVMSNVGPAFNGFDGIGYVYADSEFADSVISLTDVDSSNNGGAGIDVIDAYVATGGVASVSLVNVTANGNSNNGISEIYASTLGDSTTANIALSNVEAGGNGANGIHDIWGSTEGDNSDVVLSLLNVNTDNNMNYGIEWFGGEAYGNGGGVFLGAVNCTANGNGNAGFYQIWGDAWGTDGSVGVILDTCSANNNGLSGVDWGYGALVKLWNAPGAGDGGIYVNNCQFSGNDDQGLWLDLQIDGGTARIIGQNNTIANNGMDGLLVGALPGSGLYSLDFGGGAEGSLGLNEVYGNDQDGFGFYDVNNVGTGPLTAENNWWGTATPLAAQFAGTVDYDPWLTSAP